MNIHHLPKGDVIGVPVPGGYTFSGFEVFFLPFEKNPEKQYLAGIENGTSYTFRGLPAGRWQILYLASEASEEQAAEMVPDIDGYPHDYVQGVTRTDTGVHVACTDTFLQSLHSWCHSIGSAPNQILLLKPQP